MPIPDNLAFFSHIPMSVLVWFALVASGGLFGVISAVLIFHWTKYRLTARVPTTLLFIYICGGCIPLLVMFSVALTYLP